MKKAVRKSTHAKSTVRTKGDTGSDIVELILRDHRPLKALIRIMKSETATFAKKKAAFQEFAPSLLAHAKPEEKTWYLNMKTEEDMMVEGLEGDIEHGLADQLCTELKATTDSDQFMAKVKVLAELVEHHIKEEEEDMLPAYRHRSTKEQRATLGAKYENLRTQFGARRSVREKKTSGHFARP